ncbi:hypothetical protein QYM36_001242 [Artemia franciscana]|uniref:HAT C-terminal dimerisation domain-containing protein n=1 Tax=Artemia franciscana TaxID=6661 RepID=A0AA88LBV1_ARTSF|nr:hypothetical protein QYM36_001242 [Artemia franciscana]
MGRSRRINIEKATNFMRQFRDPESRELTKLSANQFMDVWGHYDKDGVHPSDTCSVTPDARPPCHALLRDVWTLYSIPGTFQPHCTPLRYPLTEFWIGTRTEFPTITDMALNVLLPFNTAYLSEVTFSALTDIKSQYRSAIKNVGEVLRPAVSNIKPIFDLLCNKKQAYSSH